jgi:hypothetical protein
VRANDLEARLARRPAFSACLETTIADAPTAARADSAVSEAPADLAGSAPNPAAPQRFDRLMGALTALHVSGDANDQPLAAQCHAFLLDWASSERLDIPRSRAEDRFHCPALDRRRALVREPAFRIRQRPVVQQATRLPQGTLRRGATKESGHMMNSFGRASAVALAALLMTSAPEAALAQKKKAEEPKGPPPLKLSKPVQSLAAQAQKLQQEGNHAGAVELLKQADAIPDKNADDNYIVNMLRLNSAITLKDNAMIEQSLEGALASGKLSVEDQVKFRRNLGAMALQRQDYGKAASEFEALLAMNPADADLLIEIAELQRRQGQNQKAIATLQQSIATKEKAGTKAEESWYRRTLAIAYDSKLQAETLSASEALVRAYPNATNWRDVLIIFRDGNKLDDQGNLDVLRLLRANSALTGERDYAEYAETASIRGLPGEAKAVLDEGIAKGALKAGTPFVKELLASVNPKVAADKASLPGLDKEAKAAANGRAALATGDAHLGYGEYAKAAELYRVALAKGSIDANTVNTRLGYALGRLGDKAGAEAALATVTTPPRSHLARYYQIWLNNQP